MKPRARRVTIAAAVAGAALAVLFVTRTEDLSIVLAAFALCSLAGASCSWEAIASRQDVARSCGSASVLAILPWIFIMYYWSPFWGIPRKFAEAFIVVSVGPRIWDREVLSSAIGQDAVEERVQCNRAIEQRLPRRAYIVIRDQGAPR